MVVVALAGASAKVNPVSFQMLQITPSRVWQETASIPFALPTNPRRIYRYALGGQTFVGPWHPASVSTVSAGEGLGRIYRDAVRYSTGTSGVIVDRRLSALEKRRFRSLAELYRDADVLVVNAGHPACAGLTRAQARAIATGAVTRWSQVVAGSASDTIAVRYLGGASGTGVPHLGTKWVGTLNRQRVDYATRAKSAADGGVSAAASGDQAIAAVTTWSRVRLRGGGVCVVPLGGVTPTDASVAGLQYPEAFPVSYVVTRKLTGRSALDRAYNTVLRRAMTAHLRSAKVKALLRGQGLLVSGDTAP